MSKSSPYRNMLQILFFILVGGTAHFVSGSDKPTASVPDQPGVCEKIILSKRVSLELIWIPAGTFEMGQMPNEQDAYPNKETPRHPVTLTAGYWMGKYEVTKEQWQVVMGTAPWAGKLYAGNDPQSPANYVAWNDAQQFLAKLSQLTGKSFRLPTEAEWEYAVRAGTKTRFYWGDDPLYEQIDHQAWWRGNALISPSKCARRVGLMPPNPWGLYDMSGNVSEWCQDWHWFYCSGPATNPVGPAQAAHRVLRGGSWLDIGGFCRSSRRDHETPEAAHSQIGFRVVCSPAPVPEPGWPELVDVFVAGADGVNTYRIPSLLVAPDGSLLAFCEARKQAQTDASPTDMVLKRSLDGGRNWSPTQTLVAGVGDEALMNPCPVLDRATHTILLLCMQANARGPFHNQLFQLQSDDNGRSWSAPVNIENKVKNFNDTFTPGPGIGIQLRNGRLVIPGYVGEITEETEDEFHSCVMFSDDHGETWTLGAPVAQLSDESQAVELQDGTLMLNMRGGMGKSCRGVATSQNGGESWSGFIWDRALNECPCQASIIRYSFAEQEAQNRILFANPDNAGEKFGILERTQMAIKLSYDEGQTWPVERILHPGPAAYSSLVRLPDGAIGILFEGGEKHRREWIRFARFSLAWLTEGKD